MTSETTSIQVFYGGPNGYNAIFVGEMHPGQWQRVKAEFPFGPGDLPIRIDIASPAGLIDIAAFTLRNPASETILWTAKDQTSIVQLSTNEATERISTPGTQKYCRFANAELPAQFFLPALHHATLDEPLELEIWLRVHSHIGPILPLLREKDGSRQLDALRAEYDSAVAERNALQGVNRKLQGELYITKIDAKREADKLADEITSLRDHLASSHIALNEALDRVNSEIAEATAPLQASIVRLDRQLTEHYAARQELEGRHTELQNRNAELKNRNTELESRVTTVEQTVAVMQQSRSWRITAPLRKILGRG